MQRKQKEFLMFFKAMDQLFEGKQVVLIGDSETTAIRHYDDGEGNFIEIPLTPEELTERFSRLCCMNYTNKDGKTYYSSDDETKTTVLRQAAGHVLCKHSNVLWGEPKSGKRRDKIAIWELVGGKPKTDGIPKYHFDTDAWKVISALVRQ
jgi:hypothetical protein